MHALIRLAATTALAAVGATALTVSAIGARVHEVSQKGRAFQPAALVITRGETVQVLNDDADLLHHAYVDAPDFSFDSGDQAPGEKVSIVFPVAGTFAVLCGIHPKMKLTVRVAER